MRSHSERDSRNRSCQGRSPSSENEIPATSSIIGTLIRKFFSTSARIMSGSAPRSAKKSLARIASRR